MNAHDRRARLRREFRPEPLEDRALLNAALPSPTAVAAHVAAPDQTGIHAEATRRAAGAVLTGKVAGFVSQAGLLPSQSTTASLLGTGFAGRHGDLQFLALYLVQRDDAYSGTSTIRGGNASFSSATLGAISVGYSGTEQLYGNDTVSVRLTGAVAGIIGGPYTADTGTFTAKGSFNPADAQFLLNYTIRLHKVRTAAT